MSSTFKVQTNDLSLIVFYPIILTIKVVQIVWDSPLVLNVYSISIASLQANSFALQSEGESTR